MNESPFAPEDGPTLFDRRLTIVALSLVIIFLSFHLLRELAGVFQPSSCRRLEQSVTEEQPVTSGQFVRKLIAVKSAVSPRGSDNFFCFCLVPLVRDRTL